LADGRHVATPSRKKPLLIVGALVIGALAVVAIFALSGGDAGPLTDLVGDDTPDTPEFAFEASKPKAVETSAKPSHQAAVAAAQAPSTAVTQQLDGLYTAAFLDPGNWMDGEYDDVLEFFSDDARDAAEAQLDVLTAGTEAGEAFESITPRPSTLKVHVLLDPSRVPHAVEGSARFVARGTGADGQVEFVSKGQFVFEKIDGEWLVVSFSVQRSDEEREPKPSPSGSPGASGSAEPSEAEAS
jgi:hypothetical protein